MKHKEEVSKRFEDKLSEYSSNHRPLKFIGYCLPEVSFQHKQFPETVYFFFNHASGLAALSSGIGIVNSWDINLVMTDF